MIDKKPVPGPGKYDDLCTLVRERAQSEAAIVVVVNGSKGNGFSVQGDAYVMLRLPDMLETMAKAIREGLKQ